MLFIILLIFSFSPGLCFEPDFIKRKALNKGTFHFSYDIEKLLQTVSVLIEQNSELESRMTHLENKYLENVRKLNEDFQKSFEKQENRIAELEKDLRKQKKLVRALNDLKMKGSSKIKSSETEQGEVMKRSQQILTVWEDDKQEHSSKRLLVGPMPTMKTTTPTSVIAFYAYMSSSHNEQGQHTLVFDTVKSNVGQAYHPGSGVFSVPHSGVYVFTWTIKLAGGANLSAILMVNSAEVGAAYAYSTDDNQVTGTVVVEVNQGDHVFVRTFNSFSTGEIKSGSAGWSSFAGWKLN